MENILRCKISAKEVEKILAEEFGRLFKVEMIYTNPNLLYQ
jgi:hypothetical protein